MKPFITVAFLTLFFFNGFSQVPQKAQDISPLLIGESVTDVTLKDIYNNSVSLDSILNEKPTIMVFYRGGWCPYCNIQLSAIAQSEDEILALGYQIIGVSNEDFQNIVPTVEKDKIKYSIYSDPGSKLMRQMGIAFKPEVSTMTYIEKKSKGIIADVLPVPSIFILDKSGKILFEYINPDYKTRMSVELLISVLKAL